MIAWLTPIAVLWALGIVLVLGMCRAAARADALSERAVVRAREDEAA